MNFHRSVSRAPLNSLTIKCIRTICAHPYTLNDVKTDEIPASLAQEIVDYIIEVRRGVSVAFLSRLVPNISSIDLWTLSDASSFTCNDMKILFSSAISSYTHLTDVSIGGSWMFESSSIDVVELLFDSLNLSQLKRLCIQQITMNQLIKILHTCSQLETLEIKQPCIEDGDIISITHQVDQFHCSKVTKLCIPSSLSDESIVTLTLLFPSIKCLQVPRFQRILQEFTRNSLHCESVKHTLCHLQNLTITQPLASNTICLLASFSPQVQHLSLHVQKCMDVHSVVALKMLKSLELKNCSSSPVSFKDDIVCVLRTIGANLTCLSLEYFDVVCLMQILDLCNRLKSLSIQWFNSLGDRTAHSSSSLHSLLALRLRPNPPYKLTSQLFHFICMQSKRLEYLEMHSCLMNTVDVRKMDKLSGLRCLIIRQSSKLTKSSIDHLTMSLSKLQYFVCDESVLDDC